MLNPLFRYRKHILIAKINFIVILCRRKSFKRIFWIIFWTSYLQTIFLWIYWEKLQLLSSRSQFIIFFKLSDMLFCSRSIRAARSWRPYWRCWWLPARAAAPVDSSCGRESCLLSGTSLTGRRRVSSVAASHASPQGRNSPAGGGSVVLQRVMPHLRDATHRPEEGQ